MPTLHCNQSAIGDELGKQLIGLTEMTPSDDKSRGRKTQYCQPRGHSPGSRTHICGGLFPFSELRPIGSPPQTPSCPVPHMPRGVRPHIQDDVRLHRASQVHVSRGNSDPQDPNHSTRCTEKLSIHLDCFRGRGSGGRRGQCMELGPQKCSGTVVECWPDDLVPSTVPRVSFWPGGVSDNSCHGGISGPASSNVWWHCLTERKHGSGLFPSKPATINGEFAHSPNVRLDACGLQARQGGDHVGLWWSIGHPKNLPKASPDILIVTCGETFRVLRPHWPATMALVDPQKAAGRSPTGSVERVFAVPWTSFPENPRLRLTLVDQ